MNMVGLVLKNNIFEIDGNTKETEFNNGNKLLHFMCVYVAETEIGSFKTQKSQPLAWFR